MIFFFFFGIHFSYGTMPSSGDTGTCSKSKIVLEKVQRVSKQEINAG